MKDPQKKTGFISLIGRPSSGKSTLINSICGHKISIVSSQPQTTQFIVRGIYNDKDSQMIFIDTPGYHHYNSNLNKGLTNLAVRTLTEGDLVLYLIDITRDFGEEEKEIIGHLKDVSQDVVVVFNKIDVAPMNEANIKKEIESSISPKGYIEISAREKTNIDKLIRKIKELLPIGPMYYPEEYVTDQSIPFRIKEIVREKTFINTKNEVPHSVYIDIESLEVEEDKITAHAVIFVERDSQKGIVIGKNGTMIKKIGEQSRHELKDIFERNVNLFLKVKVHYKWRRENIFLKKKFKIE